MSAINHDVTEDDLKEVYEAVVAIQCEKGHPKTDAQETANTLAYAIFRNLLTLDSVKSSIVANARKVFSH